MEEKKMTSHSLYMPECAPAFSVGMMYDSTFIVTRFQQRSDLGDCIICTRAPHYVAKIREFKTTPQERKSAAATDRQRDIAAKCEGERHEWMRTRLQAERNGKDATRRGCTVKELIEQHGTYDDEFDEPRLIAKVPGLNVYLELFGCLDYVDAIDWDGEFGACATLKKMSTWAQNNWDRRERRALASKADAPQMLNSWQEDYNEELRPFMPQKRGIGIWPNVDASRRPELLYSKAPQFADRDLESIYLLKRATAEAAAKKR